MSRPRRLSPVLSLCGAVLVLGLAGCRHAQLPPSSSPEAQSAQQQFLQAFLAAHESKNIDAQQVLVDWDNLTDESRNHFLRENIRGMIDVGVKSAVIEDIPGLSPQFAVSYNIPPEKFLTVVYADPRGDIRIKYPIGRKEDGRYYLAMFGLTREAFAANVRRFQKTSR